MLRVLLPAEFQDADREIILAYVTRGQSFRQAEWRRALGAFDLLRDAAILTQTGLHPFPTIYREQVDNRFADKFIEELLAAPEVRSASIPLWAAVARQIMPILTQAGLYRQDVPATQLLIAYCLYWWRSFTLGYSLEIEIVRDLTASGIQFQAHDLTQRDERFSPYDLIVSGFQGDIKSSLYFLQAARSQSLSHDFYITQMESRNRLQTLVVFVQGQMWDEVDGDTLFTLLSQIADTLPRASRIVHRNVEITVIEYELWKEKLLAYQKRGGSE